MIISEVFGGSESSFSIFPNSLARLKTASRKMYLNITHVARKRHKHCRVGGGKMGMK